MPYISESGIAQHSIQHPYIHDGHLLRLSFSEYVPNWQPESTTYNRNGGISLWDSTWVTEQHVTPAYNQATGYWSGVECTNGVQNMSANGTVGNDYWTEIIGLNNQGIFVSGLSGSHVEYKILYHGNVIHTEDCYSEHTAYIPLVNINSTCKLSAGDGRLQLSGISYRYNSNYNKVYGGSARFWTYNELPSPHKYLGWSGRRWIDTV